MNFNSSYYPENFNPEAFKATAVTQLPFEIKGTVAKQDVVVMINGVTFNEYFTANELNVKALVLLAKTWAKFGPAMGLAMELNIDEKFYPIVDAIVEFGRTCR